MYIVLACNKLTCQSMSCLVRVLCEILDIIANFQCSDMWHVPQSTQERNELLLEADFYSLPQDIIDVLKAKV
jgi:hypothetical protein